MGTFTFNLNIKWEEDQVGATGTKRTSLIQNLDSTEVSPIQSSDSTMSVRRRLPTTRSLPASIWFATRRSKSPPKLLRPLELPVTNTCKSTSEERTSTRESESTHGTSLESTRCFLALVPIDS